MERDNGAAWKLILKMLARGSLYDNERKRPLRVTARTLLEEHFTLFEDTYQQLKGFRQISTFSSSVNEDDGQPEQDEI